MKESSQPNGGIKHRVTRLSDKHCLQRVFGFPSRSVPFELGGHIEKCRCDCEESIVRQRKGFSGDAVVILLMTGRSEGITT